MPGAGPITSRMICRVSVKWVDAPAIMRSAWPMCTIMAPNRSATRRRSRAAARITPWRRRRR